MVISRDMRFHAMTPTLFSEIPASGLRASNNKLPYCSRDRRHMYSAVCFTIAFLAARARNRLLSKALTEVLIGYAAT